MTKTFEFITEEAVSTAGMTKREAATFHTLNPNGAVAKLPKSESFVIDGVHHYGASYLYSDLDNYHAKRLFDIATRRTKSFTRWDVEYHAKQAAKDAAKGWEFISDKQASVN